MGVHRRRVALRSLPAACAAAGALLAAGNAFAAGTAAGTALPNAVTLEYSIGGVPAPSIIALAPVVNVGEVISAVLVAQDSTPVPAGSPELGRALGFVLTNTGNGPEGFRLVRNNALAGDQFDPTDAAPAAIYLESGAQPGFQPSGPNADTAYQPGLNDPLLAADASLVVYLVSNIPAGQAPGARGDVSLVASATTPGAAGAPPGTALAGLGQGGVDAVVGGTNGQATATGTYIVAGVAVTVVKSVTGVQDPQGGTLVMPGAVLSYRIVLTVTGNGIAENLSLNDPLPATTTYVPASVQVDGAARSDAADADNTSVAGGAISVVFGNTTAPATHVIEFKATVN